MMGVMRSVRDELVSASAHHVGLCDIPPAHYIEPALASSVIFSAPHAGRYYATEMFCENQLERARTLEEQGTDNIVSALASAGYAGLIASASRAVVDVNRPISAQDSKLHTATEPGTYTNNTPYQPYISAGYGVIPRLDATRQPLHDAMLESCLVKQILTLHHLPYHNRIEQMLADASRHNGQALLCDIHSMPDDHTNRRLADIIFGNLHGATCTQTLSRKIDQFMSIAGFSWSWNSPYAGGYITRHYGLNTQHQTLQIEINRAIFETPQRQIHYAQLSRITKMLSSLAAIISDGVAD